MKKSLFLLFTAISISFTGIAQTNTFPNDGNVGIGTTSPFSPLQINSSSDGILTFKTVDNTWLYTNWMDSTNTRRTWMGLGSDLSSFNITTQNGTDKILFNGGNVGIGTTNPGGKLHVNGNIRATQSITVDKNGSYRIGLNAEADGYITGRNDLVENTFRIHSNGISFFNGGNVGIGTTSPNNLLDIEKNHNGSTILEITNNNTGNLARRGISIGQGTPGKSVYLLSTSANYNEVNTWSNAGVLGTDSQLSNGLIMRSSVGKIRFQPGGITDKIVFDDNGNVGIGTTNPTEKIHVEGNLLLDAYQTGGQKGLFFRENFTTSKQYNLSILTHDDGDNSPDALDINAYDGIYFNTGSNNRNPRMVVKGDGNVGIGTTAPDAKLSIYLPNGTASYPTTSNSGNTFMKSRSSNSGIEFGNSIGFNDRKAWIIARHSDVSNYGKYYSTLHLQPDVGDKSQYRGVSIGYEASTQLPVNTHLAVSGNVGIGTTTPDSKLAVNGNIHAKEVKIDLIGWPDYVFESNYNLPTLQEVENHIIEKGHLENIPSAAEVSENGIQLGDMNAKLLQKIEELTLYMIEQNKKTEQLQKEVTALQKKNIELEKKIK